MAALVETAARAGVLVTFPQAGALPRGVDGPTGLTAYRITQEALANAARHAPGGPVHISVRATADTLLVDVVNGPPTGTTEVVPISGGGHGLDGMRERVAALGGSLDAGPQPDGGYLVAARLPLTTSGRKGPPA